MYHFWLAFFNSQYNRKNKKKDYFIDLHEYYSSIKMKMWKKRMIKKK